MASSAPPSDADPDEAAPRRASLALLGVPALAAVLAFALWWSTPTLGALAPYELEVVSPPSAGPVPAGAESPRIELAADQGFAVVLRPRGTNAEPVEARAFVEGGSAGAPLTPLTIVTDALPGGALRVTLSRAALPPEGRLRVLIGRSGMVPRNPAGTALHGRDWQRFDLGFVQTAPPAR
jgi:hypothetical protein